jgi:hypothetical protein
MERIVEAARQYIGQKEKPGNMGFINPEFDKKMREVGFVNSHAWCAYFAELVWREAGQDTTHFSASAFKTYLQYEAAGRKGSKTAVPGALAVWRSVKNGRKGWTGHIGIVAEASAESFKCIEGNTNKAGGREGIEVALKVRTYNWKQVNGLELVGFIHPVNED